jgi:hypothetical protein
MKLVGVLVCFRDERGVQTYIHIEPSPMTHVWSAVVNEGSKMIRRTMDVTIVLCPVSTKLTGS